MANICAAPEPLFSILPTRPTGIARLAAEAEHADDGHLIEFRTLAVRSLLNRSESKRRLSLSWSINPYRGCEFACRYCYARYTHQFLEPVSIDEAAVAKPAAEAAPEAPQPWATAFEREIYLKSNAAWLLEQELRRVRPGEEIAIGTATDPYQPIERRARITRSLLEVFARRSGLRIGIVTKSKLIERDVDLLRAIARRNDLVVHITITTPDATLARLLEPRAPRPDLRFAAVRRLRDAGLRCGILNSPLLPGLNDTPEAIDEMARRAALVGASFLAGGPLFLKACSRPTYLSFVREHFPHLLSLYEEHFRHADFAAPAYRARMSHLVREACRRHGIEERSDDALLTRVPDSARRPASGQHTSAQQALFA